MGLGFVNNCDGSNRPREKHPPSHQPPDLDKEINVIFLWLVTNVTIAFACPVPMYASAASFTPHPPTPGILDASSLFLPANIGGERAHLRSGEGGGVSITTFPGEVRLLEKMEEKTPCETEESRWRMERVSRGKGGEGAFLRSLAKEV